MIEYTKVVKEVQAPTRKVCDVCGTGYATDDLECEEFLHIDFVGGYDSIFGDESRVRCDLCQRCLQKLLGPHLRIDG